MPQNPPLCALCLQPISDDTDSDEHIFPNSIGGRRTVRSFICKTCNNSKGHTWDADLAKQFNALSILCGISRDRGEPPPERVETGSGKAYLMKIGGAAPATPTFKEVDLGGGAKAISIVARSIKEVKKMLPGLKKKYPTIDTEKLLQQAAIQSDYLDDYFKIGLKFDGKTTGPSVVKSALAFAADAGISPASCERALSYLRNPGGAFCWDFLYETDPLKNRPKGTPLHCVAIQGYETGELVGYVEYFGFRRNLIRLSDQYSGPLIKQIYALDPVSGKELEVELDDLPKTAQRLELQEELRRITDALNSILKPAMQRAREREMNRIVEDAVRYALANCGAKPGERISHEAAARFSRLVVEKLKPWIEHQFRNPLSKLGRP